MSDIEKDSDEVLAKKYATLLQQFNDQLFIFESLTNSSKITRIKLLEVEKELLKRGFSLNEVEEKKDEYTTNKS